MANPKLPRYIDGVSEIGRQLSDLDRAKKGGQSFSGETFFDLVSPAVTKSDIIALLVACFYQSASMRTF